MIVMLYSVAGLLVSAGCVAVLYGADNIRAESGAAWLQSGATLAASGFLLLAMTAVLSELRKVRRGLSDMALEIQEVPAGSPLPPVAPGPDPAVSGLADQGMAAAGAAPAAGTLSDAVQTAAGPEPAEVERTEEAAASAEPVPAVIEGPGPAAIRLHPLPEVEVVVVLAGIVEEAGILAEGALDDLLEGLALPLRALQQVVAVVHVGEVVLVVVILQGFPRHVGLQRVVGVGKVREGERHGAVSSRVGV